MYQSGGAPRVYRPITATQAQEAFNKYYVNPTLTRGPRKGQAKFTELGLKRAVTYDKNHTGKRVVADARYLRNPHRYDFQGVDTGAMVRKPASAKQLDWRAKFAALRRKVKQTGGNPLDAFNKYYAGPVVPVGPQSGKPVFKSLRGMKAARTYDLNHTGRMAKSAQQYERNPHRYDLQGVDTGAMVRKPPTAKQLAARAAFADRARARSAAAKAAKAPTVQTAGAPRAYKPITADQARAAFTEYYASNPTYSRGPRKGVAKFTAQGAKLAMAYDTNHTGKRVVADTRYLRNPHRFDFQGVDTGAKVRKTSPPTAKQLAARAAFTAMAKARSKKGNQVAGGGVAGGVVDDLKKKVSGYWW